MHPGDGRAQVNASAERDEARQALATAESRLATEEAEVRRATAALEEARRGGARSEVTMAAKGEDKRKHEEDPEDEGLTVWEREFRRLHPETWKQMQDERCEQEKRA